ncbi:MAG: hypothetical protein OHK0050_29240 [Roseiflexaceae bacterium]
MSLQERERWIEQMMKQTGCSCFHNIAGVIDFFQAKGVGAQGSWISIVDAAILQGISLGYGDFLAQQGQGSVMTNVNSGADDWTKFFDEFTRNPNNTLVLTTLWGRAEQAATEYGEWYAEHGINPRTGKSYGLHPSVKETGLILATDAYRGAVQVPGSGRHSVFNPFNPNLRTLVKDLAVIYWDTMTAVGL